MPPQNSRYGLYYFPDTNHYRENDLRAWIPELEALGASWLTLLAPVDRAIPEAFVRGVIEGGINPVIHLPIPLTSTDLLNEITVIFEAYAHWGVQYITLFDRPNLQKNWSPALWTQKNLVERFLDKFIPLAELVLRAGMTPVFPPLEPGGDYWDTAFLSAAIQGLQRRNQNDLIDRIALSAYAWLGNRSTNWGAGGPERWPETKPYSTNQNSEDQLGFRIFDWYLSVAHTALGKALPIILLAAGSKLGDQQDPDAPAVDVEAHTWQNMTLIRLLSGKNPEMEPVPSEVLTCNFWVLSSAEDDPEVMNAWYKPDHETLPVVGQLKAWVSNSGGKNFSSVAKYITTPSTKYYNSRPIAHYLLLPASERGQADWHLDAIRPFITKYQPTIGFSPIEASHAKKVTVISGTESVPESIIDGLLAAGCVVEHISGDGMNIASHKSSHTSE